MSKSNQRMRPSSSVMHYVRDYSVDTELSDSYTKITVNTLRNNNNNNNNRQRATSAERRAARAVIAVQQDQLRQLQVISSSPRIQNTNHSKGLDSSDVQTTIHRPLEDLSPEEIAISRRHVPAVYDAIVLYDAMYLNLLSKLTTKETELEKCIGIGQEVLDQLQEMRKQCKELEEALYKTNNENEEIKNQMVTFKKQRNELISSHERDNTYNDDMEQIKAMRNELRSLIIINKELTEEINDLKVAPSFARDDVNDTRQTNRSLSFPKCSGINTTGRFDRDLSPEDTVEMTSAAALVAGALFALRSTNKDGKMGTDQFNNTKNTINAAFPAVTFSSLREDVEMLHRETLSAVETVISFQDIKKSLGDEIIRAERNATEAQNKVESLNSNIITLQGEVSMLQQANESLVANNKEIERQLTNKTMNSSHSPRAHHQHMTIKDDDLLNMSLKLRINNLEQENYQLQEALFSDRKGHGRRSMSEGDANVITLLTDWATYFRNNTRTTHSNYNKEGEILDTLDAPVSVMARTARVQRNAYIALRRMAPALVEAVWDSTSNSTSRQELPAIFAENLPNLNNLPEILTKIVSDEISLLVSMISESDQKHRSNLAIIQEKEEHVRQLKLRIDAASSDNEQLYSTRTRLEEEVSELRKSTNDESVRLHRLTASTSDLTNEIMRLQTRIEFLEGKLEQTVAEKNNEINLLKECYEDINGTLQTERADRTQYSEHTHSILADLRSQVTDMTQQMQQNNICHSTTQKSQEGVIESLKAENWQLRTVNQEKDDHIEKFTKMLQKAREEIDSLGGDLTTLQNQHETAKDREETARREIKDVRMEGQKRIDELLRDSEKYQVEIKVLHEKVSEMNEIVQKEKRSSIAAIEKMTYLNTQLEDAHESIQVLEAKLANVENNRDKYVDLFNQLKMENEANITENTALIEHASELQKRLGILDADIDPIRRRLHQAIISEDISWSQHQLTPGAGRK